MTKPPANRYRDSNNEADSEDEMENRFGLTSALIKVTNLTLFGVGSVLFIIGLLYLTVYRYEYSFTVFSIDMMAGISLALGAVLAFISLWAVLTMTAFGKPAGALLQAIFVFFAFVLLFILGVIGLSLNGNGELLTQNRNYMYYTAREFNEQVPYKHATKKFDWLQRKFLCCGIDSYQDWKGIVTFRGNSGGNYNYNPNEQIAFINQNRDQFQHQNKFPYIDDVPDSCCINIAASCGKQSYSFGRDRTSLINIRGCLTEYNRYFSKDIIFLCSMGIVVGLILLIVSFIQMFMYTLIKRNHEGLVKTYNQEQRRFVSN